MMTTDFLYSTEILRLRQTNKSVKSELKGKQMLSPMIVTSSRDGTAKLWNVETGRLIHTFEGHTAPVSSAVFSKDGYYILTTSFDRTAKLWHAHTGEFFRTFSGHTDDVVTAVFSSAMITI